MFLLLKQLTKGAMMDLNMVDACCEMTANCYTNPPHPLTSRSHAHDSLPHTNPFIWWIKFDESLMSETFHMPCTACGLWLPPLLNDIIALANKPWCTHAIHFASCSPPKNFPCKWKWKHTFLLQFDDFKSLSIRSKNITLAVLHLGRLEIIGFHLQEQACFTG